MTKSSKYLCTRCSKEKTEDLMCKRKGKITKICKKCHSFKNKIYRDKLSDEEKRKRSKIHYQKQRLRYLESEDKNEIIDTWIKRQCIRRKESRPQYEGRIHLDRDLLYQMCLHAQNTFPYMTFKNLKSDGDESRWKWASLDRIDSTKPYSDDNVCVVPMWLNSAKMNMTYEKLFELFENIDTDELKMFLECNYLFYDEKDEGCER